MKKVDLKKELKALYRATTVVQELDAGEGCLLSVSGKGEPGGSQFQENIQRIYGAAYTLKFSLKKSGLLDFVVAPLECIYHDDACLTPRQQWRWTLLIRVPDEVTPRQLEEALSQLKSRRGVDSKGVELHHSSEGHCVQVLHVGPYDQVGPVYENLKKYIDENGLRWAGAPREVYLSDPKRVAPEKLKTIIRVPVEKVQQSGSKGG